MWRKLIGWECEDMDRGDDEVNNVEEPSEQSPEGMENPHQPPKDRTYQYHRRKEQGRRKRRGGGREERAEQMSIGMS